MSAPTITPSVKTLYLCDGCIGFPNQKTDPDEPSRPTTAALSGVFGAAGLPPRGETGPGKRMRVRKTTSGPSRPRPAGVLGPQSG